VSDSWLLIRCCRSKGGRLGIAPINRKVVLSDKLKAQTPSSEAEIKKLIRIDRVEMNKQLDNWAELWNREIEAKR